MSISAYFRNTLPAFEKNGIAELRFGSRSESHDTVVVHNLAAASVMIESERRLEVGTLFRICLPPNPLVTITWTNGSIAIGQFDTPLPFKTLCLNRIKSVVGPELKVDGDEVNSTVAFGRRFYEARVRNRMTQGEVAETLNVTTATVSWWESGRSFPNEKRWAKIESCLGISVAQLVADDAAESLQDVVKICRERIAKAAGTTPQDVSITVNI